jgi:toxin FitB
VIVLDTNVLAELMRQPAQRDPHVVRFVSDAPLETLFIPSIAVAEVRYGIARLPVGHRRATLQAIWSRILADGFEGRVLAFDDACAARYAEIRVIRETLGRPVAMADAMIGSVAATHGATLATRNVKDFDGYGLSVVDPWNAR